MKPEEATKFIPKVLDLVEGRITRKEAEVLELEEVKNEFMENLDRLKEEVNTAVGV